MAIGAFNIATEICCVLFLLTMLIALVYKQERSRSFTYIILIFLAVILSVVADLFFRFRNAGSAAGAGIYVDYAISYAAYVFLVCSFSWYFFARFEEKGAQRILPSLRWWVAAYSVFLVVLVVSSVWTGWFFRSDGSGSLEPAKYFNWVAYIFLPLILFDFYVIWRHRTVLGRTETAVMFLYVVLPSAAYVLDMRYSTVLAHLALTLVASMLYIFVETEQEKRLIRTRQELAEMHLNSMTAQINPHFIHNTLSSIESLARSRPEEARALMHNFSEYMSDSYMDMTKRPVIPFWEEMEHVEHYLAIEKVRFPNLVVVTDLQALDFPVPCLSVQPLVENAVKHGICRVRKSSGTVTITSRETDSAFLVTVTDDGAGFDPAAEPDTTRPHLGIENTARRLEMLCGGTLTVQSRPGAGTECRMVLPKEGKRS